MSEPVHVPPQNYPTSPDVDLGSCFAVASLGFLGIAGITLVILTIGAVDKSIKENQEQIADAAKSTASVAARLAGIACIIWTVIPLVRAPHEPSTREWASLGSCVVIVLGEAFAFVNPSVMPMALVVFGTTGAGLIQVNRFKKRSQAREVPEEPVPQIETQSKPTATIVVLKEKPASPPLLGYMVRWKCKCGKALKAPWELRDKRFTCPQCKTKGSVPRQSQENDRSLEE